MRNLLKVIALVLLAAGAARAQYTTVSATVKDPTGQIYANGSFTVQFYDPQTSGKLPLINGAPFQKVQAGQLDSFGSLSIIVGDNAYIASSSGATGTQWIFHFCSQAYAQYQGSKYCFDYQTTISGATQDITTGVQAASATLPALSGVGTVNATAQYNIFAQMSPGTASIASGTHLTTDATGNNLSIPGTLSAAGLSTLTGGISSPKINNIIYVDGTTYTTANAALSACPAAGCVIDMRGNGNATALALGTFDPGSKTVTLLLGPYSYTVTQIKLENNFHLIGMGSNSSNGTLLTATSTTLSPIVLGTTASVAGVVMSGFRLDGATSNTGNGIDIIAGANGGGLWYSEMEDIIIGATTPFGGIGLNFDGSAGGTPTGVNQLDSIKNVFVFGGTGRTYTCQWLGENGQFSVINSECDGNSTSAGTNINIASSAASLGPYSLVFQNLTDQDALVGVRISGANNITFMGFHCENVSGAVNMSLGTGGFNDYGMTIEDSDFETCGVNSGSGYIVSNSAGATNSNLNFVHNRFGNTPDAYFSGFTTNLYEAGTLLASGSYRGNTTPTSITVGSGTAMTSSGLGGTMASQSTLTNKTGTGAGNYTTTSTTFVAVDGTNLSYTVTIPTGYKLFVRADGTETSATAAVADTIGLNDGACSGATVNLTAEQIVPTSAGNVKSWALGWILTGDGASHTINLCYLTSNASDAATIINSSVMFAPTMQFMLMTSN